MEDFLFFIGCVFVLLVFLLAIYALVYAIADSI